MDKSAFFWSIVLATTAAPSSALAAEPPATCPAKTFDGFLAAFMDSTVVQRQHVTIPLSSTTINAEAEPEPAPVEKHLSMAEIPYPVMPSTSQQAKEGLKRTLRSVSPTDTEVKLAQGDNGYQLRFLFRKTAGCWKLAKIMDDSI